MGEPGERISEHIVPGKNKCLELEANGSNVKWENSVINFDNVGTSLKYKSIFHLQITSYESTKKFYILFDRKRLSIATSNCYIQRVDGDYG